MKYTIKEYPATVVIFIESEGMKAVCTMADLIERTYPESVLEVTHHCLSRQGRIIVMKNDVTSLGGIKEIVGGVYGD
jgi:hypothetical protein